MKMKTKMKNELVKVLKKEYQFNPGLDKVDDCILVDVSKNNVGVYAAIDDTKVEILQTPDYIKDFRLMTTYSINTDASLIAKMMYKLLG